MPLHIVWDWNGTLLDDLDLVVRSVSSSIQRLGHPPITADDYRDHYTRPVRRFYDSLFGREVDDMEWSDLNKTFHDLYHAGVDGAALTRDAVETLERVARMGWGQSLLSMSTQSHLIPTVRARGIDGYFRLITGLDEASGDLKKAHLLAHLASQELAPGDVLVVGDTPDDHAAATAVGARTILFDGGSHHRAVLEALGAPVADTLAEVFALIEEDAAA